jgi:hypothetical protein
MGRWDTGAITTGQCLQLNINAFADSIKNKRFNITGQVSWTNGATIGVSLQQRKENVYIATLDYTKTKGEEKQKINYQVLIVGLPSNLGKGLVYYFVCPFRQKRCKVLYMGYGSLYFKSREAYQHRIYYASQMSSRLDKHNDKYWSLEHKLENLYNKHPKTHYRGKKTKAQKRIEWLEQKQDYHEKMRWVVLPKVLLKSMAMYGVNDPKDLF